MLLHPGRAEKDEGAIAALEVGGSDNMRRNEAEKGTSTVIEDYFERIID